MKNEINFSYYIERYLDGEMTAEERHWFTREMKGNSSLKKEFELRARLNVAIRETEVREFRKQLNFAFEKSGVEKKTHTVFSRKIATYLAAGIILLAGTIAVSTFRNMDNETLYIKYFRPAEAGYTFRADDQSGDLELQTALQLYESGKYSQALVFFEKIIAADNTRIGLNLYSGISQMEIRKFKDAHTSFRKIIDNNYILFLEQAEWYLAFCYLMTDDVDKARDQFALIKKRKGFYSQQAGRILRRIN